MLTLNKTKAALPSCQCHYKELNQIQNTRTCAGGQRMSVPVMSGACIFKRCANPTISKLAGCQPNIVVLVLHNSLRVARLRSPELERSNSRVANLQLTAVILSEPLAHTPISPVLGKCRGLDYVYRYPDIGDHSLSAPRAFSRCSFLSFFRKASNGNDIDCFCCLSLSGGSFSCSLVMVYTSGSSFGFLRCSAFSLRPQASSTHAEKLAPDFSIFSRSTLASISSMSSCGNRMCFLADLLLVLPVAISAILKLGVSTPYTKEMAIKTIDVGAHQNVRWAHTLFWLRCKNSEARQCANTNRASDHNVIGANTMAELQSIQTRPEFTWLFLATPKHYPECSPIVLRFDADTEETARGAFPGWNLVFAAKIRAHAPCRVVFFDYNSRRGWEFDSAVLLEVRHG